MELFEIYSADYLAKLHKGERHPGLWNEVAYDGQTCNECGHREIYTTLMLRHIALCHPVLMGEIRQIAPPEVLEYDVHWNYLPTVTALSRSVPPEEAGCGSSFYRENGEGKASGGELTVDWVAGAAEVQREQASGVFRLKKKKKKHASRQMNKENIPGGPFK